MNRNIRLISIDFDGTLLDDSSRLTGYTKEVLRKIAEKGVIIYPNTGRGIEVLYSLIQEMPFVEYFSAMNGAMIYKGEEVISRNPLPRDTAVKTAEVIEDLGLRYFVVGDGFYFDEDGMRKMRKGAIYRPFLEEDTAYIRQRGLLSFIEKSSHDICKIVALFEDNSRREILKERLSAIEGIDCRSSHTFNLEINSSKAGKGFAVDFLMDLLDVKEEEVLSIGDNDNDIPMMKTRGVKVVLKNGTEGLKKICDHITDLDNGHDGAADFLKHYFDI